MAFLRDTKVKHALELFPVIWQTYRQLRFGLITSFASLFVSSGCRIEGAAGRVVEVIGPTSVWYTRVFSY